MLHGGKIKSTPSPRPKTGVRQKSFYEFVENESESLKAEII